MRELWSNIMIETMTYRRLKQMAVQLNVPLPALWGVAHYSNFLEQYKRYTSADGLIAALTRFNIPSTAIPH
ncbi:hypothetical protein HY486_01430 [Candidatus Woesearchaeota archaeon]|nr:hypothetical protein [Candidatus Woesearchaeota archaeon]